MSKRRTIQDVPKDTVTKFTLEPVYEKIISALQLVSYLPGSWEKKFARSISGEVMLSEKQKEWVVKLFHKYRRQIRDYDALCLELEPEKFKVEAAPTLFGIDIKLVKEKK